MNPNSEQTQTQVLVFELADHLFGFNMLDLSAVTRILEITPVARAADFFEGLINLRGKLTPVIDLRAMFLMPKKEVDSRSRLLALKGEGYELCVKVDAVQRVLQLDSQKLEPPPEILYNEYIQTVYKIDEKLILILDSKKLVNPEEVKNIIENREKTRMILPEPT